MNRVSPAFVLPQEKKLRAVLDRAAVAVIIILLGSVWEAAAAPYPSEGRLIEWMQPDGTPLTLRVFGDEFYARTETTDGYAVAFDEQTMTYRYAVLDANQESLVPSETPADRFPPHNLEKHLRESPTTIAARQNRNIQEVAPDRAANWAKRVNAVRLQRALSATGMSPAAASSPSSNALSGAEAALAAPVSGPKAGLFILVQFPDDPATAADDSVNFPTTQAKIERMANAAGYADDGNTGSVCDYFYDQSNGQLTFTQVVTAVITLPHPRNYYGYSDYPSNLSLRDSGGAGRLLVADAVAKLKTEGFDFSALSVDSSNRVFATSLLFAGPDSGVWTKGLWPHSFYLSTSINVGTSNAPRYIYSYQCTNTPDAAPVIGTLCHELGHLLLGYPDLYDTDASDGGSEGVGAHCLMGSGNHLNSGRTPAPIDLYLKDFSGWANITDVTPAQSLTAALASTGNQGRRIRKPGSTTEYFLIENRGPGDKWAAYCKDQGIAIWHVDEAVTTDNKRQQRTASQHYELSLEQADGSFDLENNVNRGDSTDLYDSSTTTFTDSTNPNARWWDGSSSGISVAVLSVPGASMDVEFGAATSPATLTLDPASRSVPATGGTSDFAVTSNTTWNWSCNATWVTSSEPASQTGSQTFTYIVAANATPTNRTATVTVTGGGLTRTHVISQAAGTVDDHGNSTSSATVVAQNSTTNGNIETASDNDYFRIDVTTSGSLLVQTSGLTDTYGYLLNSSGAQLAFDDDSGASTNFRIAYAVIPGTYFVRVRHYSNTQTGAYQLVCSLTVTPTQTLSVSPAVQNIGGTGSTVSFTVSASGAWTWGVNQSWVSSNEAVNQTGNQIFTYEAPANSSAAVRTAQITFSSGTLTATHTITQGPAVADDHGNTTSSATLVAQNSTTDGNIETASDNDYFRINVTATGLLVVQTTGSTDTYGYLLDSSGTTLVSDDDSGEGFNFRLSYPVSPGAYYVRARHHSSLQTGPYQLLSVLEALSPPTPTTTGSIGLWRSFIQTKRRVAVVRGWATAEIGVVKYWTSRDPTRRYAPVSGGAFTLTLRRLPLQSTRVTVVGIDANGAETPPHQLRINRARAARLRSR